MFDSLFDVTLSTDVRQTISGISKATVGEIICPRSFPFKSVTMGVSFKLLMSNKRGETSLGFLLCAQQNTGPSVLETERHEWNLRYVIFKKEAIFLVMKNKNGKRRMGDWERVHNRHV